MALTSREVAEAYIEVHGDITPFRKSLNRAGKEAIKAGNDSAGKFSDEWNKRLGKDVPDKWGALVDTLYSKNPVDLNRLIKKFDDNGDIDAASAKIEAFMQVMRDEGKLTANQHKNARTELRELIKAKQQDLFVTADIAKVTRDHSEAIRMNLEMDRQRAAQLRQNDMLVRAHAAAIRIDEDRTRKLAKAAQEAANMLAAQGRAAGWAVKMMRPLQFIGEKMSKSWARMDSTVRTVLTLVAASAGSIATLGSGLAGAGTALVSSLAMGIGGLSALTPALAGIAVGIGLAVSAFDEMKARVPGIQQALDSITTTWNQQADAFGRNWEGALERLLANFAAQIGKYDFGAAFGTAFANITDAFNNVVSGPGFAAFMQAMTGTIPNAVRGLGIGFAGLTGALFSFMAGAAPVAQQLGQDFAAWGQKIGEAVEKARASGALTETLGKMRESLLAVLDFTGSLVLSLGTLFGIGAESGNRMLASLTQIVDRFTAWMNTEAGRAAMVEWFNNAEAIMRSMAPLLVGIGEAMAILVTPETIAQFANLMDTVGQLLPILAEVLAVISALGILNMIASLFLVVGQAIQPLLPPLMQLAQMLGPIIQGAIMALAPLFQALVAAMIPIVNAVIQIIGVIGPMLIPAIQQIVAAVTPVIAVFGELIAFIVGILAPILGPLLAGMINGVVLLFQGLSNMIMGAVDIIRAIIQGMATFFQKIFQGDIGGALNALSTMFGQIFAGIGRIILGAVQAITGFIQVYIVGRLVSLVRSGLTSAFNFFKSIWSNISGAVSGALGRITGFVSGGMSRVGSTVSSWMSNVRNAISGAWNSAVSFVSGAMGRIGGAVSSGVGRVMSFIGALPGRIVGALSGLGGRLSAMGSQMMAGFIGGIQSMAGRIFDAAMSAVGNAVNAVKNFLGIRSPSRLMAWMARMTWQGFIGETGRMEGAVASAAGVMADAVVEPFARQNMYATGRAAVADLAAGLASNSNLLGKTLDSITPKMQMDIARDHTIPGVSKLGQSAPSAVAGPSTVFEEGAIQFQTKVQDPKTAANQLLDVLARNAKIG